ncbi:hypothetical protein R2C72_004609 [Salmonella enterica]|nr:hypothetical protein [Salmonella enterica]ELF1294884.1 hypothetical protein [Salmonella enterica]ELP9925398.1 hypothetical protein [Salmonella enterica]ELP9926179.1 hypothetical protein [Salmonella enterica]
MKNTLRLFFFCADPKKASSGSSFLPLARGGAETQDVPFGQRHVRLYIVLYPVPVTRPTREENSGMIIPCAWYTSGNLLYARKSDHRKTIIR